MRPLVLVSAVLVLVVSAASLIACNPSTSTKIIPPTPQYLYVANDNNPGAIAQFTLPLTSTSTPNFTLAASDIGGMALDSSGDLIAVTQQAQTVSVYNAPLNASSTAVTFSCLTCDFSCGIALDSAGDLFIGDWGGNVDVYDPPFSDSSTVATKFILWSYFPKSLVINGLVFDSTGNLILASDIDAETEEMSLSVLAPPYTGAPSVITSLTSNWWYGQMAISGTQLFAPGSAIDVYNLPLTNSSAPAFSITTQTAPQVIAFDKSGNLYVGTNQGELQVFAPPFSSASTPTVTLNLTTGGSGWNITGMAITH